MSVESLGGEVRVYNNLGKLIGTSNDVNVRPGQHLLIESGGKYASLKDKRYEKGNNRGKSQCGYFNTLGATTLKGALLERLISRDSINLKNNPNPEVDFGDVKLDITWSE